jgi:membrane protein DedA with SNARE-associated domain
MDRPGHGRSRLDAGLGHRVRDRCPRGRPLLDHPGRLEKRRRKLLAKGDRAFGRYTFVASATLPAFVSGIFHVRFWLFLLGALTAGIFWIGIYVGVSYFLGEEIAKLVGKIGTKAVIGAIVLVVVGLLIRAAVSKWRGARQARPAGQDPPKAEATQD